MRQARIKRFNALDYTGTEAINTICTNLSFSGRDCKRIAFTSFMPGAGKTTVGRLLAQRLGRDFFDADEELERRFGCDIPTFFAREGEAAFRAEETALLAELGKRSGCVIATGGGCVTRPENEPLLRQNAAVIWLQRALDRLPVAGRPVSRRTTPEALYAQRAAAYARFSDGTADNNGTPDETVRQILEAWT